MFDFVTAAHALGCIGQYALVAVTFGVVMYGASKAT
jgi:hypothetical protein